MKLFPFSKSALLCWEVSKQCLLLAVDVAALEKLGMGADQMETHLAASRRLSIHTSRPGWGSSVFIEFDPRLQQHSLLHSELLSGQRGPAWDRHACQLGLTQGRVWLYIHIHKPDAARRSRHGLLLYLSQWFFSPLKSKIRSSLSPYTEGRQKS